MARWITHERLAAAMRQAMADLVASGMYVSARDVNAGYCGDFSDDVFAILHAQGMDAREGPDQVDVAMLMAPEDDGDEPIRMDRGLLATHWPMIVPPEGLDWDDVDAMAAHFSFSPGTHVWTVLDGRHYDAEVPDGVDNMFDMPFFQRLTATWQAERTMTMAP